MEVRWTPLQVRWTSCWTLLKRTPEFNGVQQSSSEFNGAQQEFNGVQQTGKWKSVEYRWTLGFFELPMNPILVQRTSFMDDPKVEFNMEFNDLPSTSNRVRRVQIKVVNIYNHKKLFFKLWSSNFYLNPVEPIGSSLEVRWTRCKFNRVQQKFNELPTNSKMKKGLLEVRWTLFNFGELFLNRFWSSTEFIELATEFNEIRLIYTIFNI